MKVEIDGKFYLIQDEIGLLLERLGKENARLKKAIEDFGKNPAGFDFAVLERIENLEVMLSEYMQIMCGMAQKMHGSPKTEDIAQMLDAMHVRAGVILLGGNNERV